MLSVQAFKEPNSGFGPHSSPTTSCPRRASISQSSIASRRTSVSSTSALFMAEQNYKSCYDRHAKATLAVQTMAHRATEARFRRDQLANAMTEKASWVDAQSGFEAAERAFKTAAAQAVSTQRALEAAKRDLERVRSGAI